jgi:hypothetical protein
LIPFLNLPLFHPGGLFVVLIAPRIENVFE